MGSVSVGRRGLSIARPFESLELEVRVRCGWTARPRVREAGKERVVFFWLAGRVSLIRSAMREGRRIGREGMNRRSGNERKLENAPKNPSPSAEKTRSRET
jgi:hypothetical protein